MYEEEKDEITLKLTRRELEMTLACVMKERRMLRALAEYTGSVLASEDIRTLSRIKDKIMECE